MKNTLLFCLVFTLTLSIFKYWNFSLREKLAASVVYVVTEDEQGGGTGFQIENDKGNKYLVTNNHVCAGITNNSEAKIKLQDGTTLKRHIIEISKDTDLCLIEPVPGMPALKLASNWLVGESVFVLGHPELAPNTFVSGEIVAEREISIVDFIINEEHPMEECTGPRKFVTEIPVFIFMMKACVSKYSAIATTVPTYPGNSGSALVNRWGQVVGVIFASGGPSYWGDAIKLSELSEFINKY